MLFCAVGDDLDMIDRVHACFDAGEDPLACVSEGATIEAVVFQRGHAEISCAGEGRVFRVREGQLEQIVMNRGTVETTAGDVFFLCSKELRWVMGSDMLESVLGSTGTPEVLAAEMLRAIRAVTPEVTVIGHIVGPDCV